MNAHLPVLPVLVPMATAVLLIFGQAWSRGTRRWLSMAGLVVQGAVLATLGGVLAGQGPQAYFLGNWSAPFGIVLVADHLSLWLLWTTWALATAALVYACRGADGVNRRFHVLFHFQLMGINGAFLTGDLFNLFVFFEVLLIASYTLLNHGGGKARTRAALHYVTLNLVGSSVFLIALGMLYASLGTLNMAHLSERMAAVEGTAETLARGAGYLLLLVFGLKAAMVPMYAWLPRTYAAASGPVAALFAIMTKVGVYAVLRVFTLLYGEQGRLAGLGDEVLFLVALLTLAAGSLGVFSAHNLRRLSAWMVVLSAGVLMAAVAMGGAELLGAMLYYLAHTTLATGLLFLLADRIRERGGAEADDWRLASLPSPGPALGILFLVAAVAAVGLPPLSGFFAKAQLLLASHDHDWSWWYWLALLGSSLILLLAFSRAGSSLFWRRSGQAMAGYEPLAVLVLAGLAATLLVLALAQQPLMELAAKAAADLLDVDAYRQLVLGKEAG